MAKTEDIMFHWTKDVKYKNTPPIPLKRGMCKDEKTHEKMALTLIFI